MKHQFALLLAFSPLLAWAASDAEILREGCNALKTPAKRAACFSAAERMTPSPRKNDSIADGAISDAKRRLSQLLNDPESVRYRSAAYSEKTKAVCGVLSAKNAMGGYGAPSRFIVTEERARIEQINDAGFEYRWSELCDEG